MIGQEILGRLLLALVNDQTSFFKEPRLESTTDLQGLVLVYMQRIIW